MCIGGMSEFFQVCFEGLCYRVVLEPFGMRFKDVFRDV